MTTMPTRRAVAATLAAVTALALSVPSAGAGGSGQKNGRFSAGAAGIGDPYFPLAGNGGYDIAHYDLTGRYTPANDTWSATAHLTGTMTADLYRFNLDLVGMAVTRIVVDGKRATWTRTPTELVITPQRKLKRGAPLDVRVTYSGVPREFVIPGLELRTGFMATDDGATVAGQPDVAAGWFPVNDHPRDKASYRFDVTVPKGLGVVANGELRHRSTSGGWSRFVWVAEEPMASYLATIDIGKWDIRRRHPAGSVPIYDAVDPDLVADPQLGPAIDSSLRRQPKILDLLSDHFGPYPFSTAGAIVDDQPDLYFALETQTRPVYSQYFWPWSGDFVVVHELAHQWFGDDVALARWQDIWLNEGFATYAEWLWLEHEGWATPQDVFDDAYGIPADDPFWELVIGRPPADNLFDFAVYLRGAMTLHALRMQVGDAAFWDIVRTWASTNSGGHGTTPEFVALAESISGRQLDALFDAWLFSGTKPSSATYSSAARTPRSITSLDRNGRAKAHEWLVDAQQRLPRLHH